MLVVYHRHFQQHHTAFLFSGFIRSLSSVDDVISAICRLPDKSCVADTLPAPQLRLVADLIAPFLTELFNRSLSTATVPEVFKSARIVHATAQEATPRLCRSTVLPSDF